MFGVKPLRHIVFSTSLALLLAFIGLTALAVYSLNSNSIESNASCAVGDSGNYIPTSLCLRFLKHQLNQAQDTQKAQRAFHLAIGAYPTHPERAILVIKAALSSGADINGFSLITGYTALHEAVLINEPELVEALISFGANPGIKDRSQGRTAADLLSAIIERNPHLNMKAIESQIKN